MRLHHGRLAPTTALVVLSAITACQGGAKSRDAAGVDTTATNATVVAGSASDAKATAGAMGNVLVARLERGPCFGRCAEYVVEVYGDGAVHFEGRHNVSAMGAQRATIPVEDVNALLRTFIESPFASADSAYMDGSAGCGHYRTDAPVSVLSARIGSELKTVRRDPGCEDAPKFLGPLESRVDSVARTSAWVAGNGGKQP